MGEPEDGAEPPATLVDGDEDGVVAECEDEAGEQVERVAEGLRAEPIDLFAVQADAVGQVEQLLHELRGSVDPAGPSECLGEPKGAGEKCPLVARETVGAGIAPDVWTVGELAPDGVYCHSHSFVA